MMAVVEVLVVSALLFSGSHGQDYPFKNTSLSLEDIVKVAICCNMHGIHML